MTVRDIFDELRRRCVPLAGSLELTHRCDLRCSHCYQFSPRPGEAEMDTSQVVGLLDRLREAGCLFLNLTGGEPLLREDLPEILEEAAERHFALTLQTNAFRLDGEVADRLARVPGLRVDVSLHAASEEKHDAFCGVKGGFRAALGALELLRERGVPCMTKTVVTRLNVGELEGVERLAEERGAAAFFSSMVFPRNDGDDAPLSLRLSDSELEAFVDFQAGQTARLLEKLGEGGGGADAASAGLPAGGPPEVPGCGEAVPDARGRVLRGCGAGRTAFCVNPYGDLYPCVAWPQVVGNVLEEDFMQLWQGSAMLAELRETGFNLSEECVTCQILADCPLCPALSFLEEGDPGATSRERCRQTRAWMKRR